ncbi:properdin isoform X2 [Hyla sarda]|uniref:properdin isoform X2 n=1 Tax=Hyla sarda TaxID=327740 RepID=UPI0024C35A64|nr:properdin isoform X2 [Hyla sarda]
MPCTTGIHYTPGQTCWTCQGTMQSTTIILLVLLLHTTNIQVTGADGVLCFSEVDEGTGECADYLGDGVSEEECCLNIKYAFKADEHSPCVGCRPAEWSQWSEWSACTVSCQEGIQERQRICIGQGDCQGEKVEVQSCSLQDCCPEKGGWSSWSSWSSCSVTCQVGQRQRTRECNNPPPSCNGECIGHPIEVEKCDTQQICPTHGSWGNWGPWNPCSSSCTKEGSGIFPVQSRFRECNNPPPSTIPPGKPCEESRQDTRECRDVPFCEVDGQWGSWQADSDCSVTCGVGRTRQKRLCNNPAPRNGGKDCAGPSIKQIICNTKKPCPIDGKWTEWNEWSPCARLQKDIIRCKQRVGNQFRHRTCEGQAHEGKWCEGKHRESRGCYDINGCGVSGSWTEWSSWGLCSAPCGQSTKSRYRECSPKYPDYPDIVEGAVRAVEVFFWGTPKPKCDPINGEALKIEETKECKNLPECS